LDLTDGEEDLEVLEETEAFEMLDASSEETVAVALTLETLCSPLGIE
jgi:hypothetical protein